jgi:hypothetical protein
MWCRRSPNSAPRILERIFVVPGLVPGHPRLRILTTWQQEKRHGRDKPGHEESDRNESWSADMRLLAVALKYLLTGGAQSLPIL